MELQHALDDVLSRLNTLEATNQPAPHKVTTALYSADRTTPAPVTRRPPLFDAHFGALAPLAKKIVEAAAAVGLPVQAANAAATTAAAAAANFNFPHPPHL